MKKVLKIYLLLFIFLWNQRIVAQNEATKWFFGQFAGLNFSTNPPSIIQTSTLSNIEGSSSIADANGNVLFYTNGTDVYTQQNITMANGSGLFGNFSSTQSALILKKPGSANLYYIFTSDYSGGANGICYSIVDMSLAAGMGSVTIKNVQLYPTSTEKLTAAKHCNGTDFWIITHELNSNNFKNYLFSSAGVNTVAVVSSVGSVYTTGAGYMKTSMNGGKIGSAMFLMNAFELYDFNQSTGIVSNPLTLTSGTNAMPYGCEFSPDGTKFYGTASNFNFSNCSLYQWNLCAGSSSAIVSSQFSITSPTANINGMQLAPNGKIYIARSGTQFLDVIHNPNALNASCNYQALAQSIAPNAANLGLPNIIASVVKAPMLMSHGLGCTTASFTPPAAANPTLVTCVSSGNPVTDISWVFGDPLSGAANTSTLINPVHTYSATGSYTTQLTINYASCASEVIHQVISIIAPTVSILSPSASCSALSSATVMALGGTGQYTYLWVPSAQTSSIASNLSVGVYTVTIMDSGNCSNTLTTSINPIPILSQINTTATCFVGTAAIQILGGSGTYSYLWSAGGITTASITGLLPGTYSVTVNDLLNQCTFSNTVQINTLPTPSISIAGKLLICLGESTTLTVGGADTYTWSSGSHSTGIVVSPTTLTTFTIEGTNTLSGCSSKKIFAVTVSNCIGLDENNTDVNNLHVYPNPSSDEMTIEIDNFTTLILCDIFGKVLMHRNCEKGLYRINLNALNNGVYIIKIICGKEIRTQKIIKSE